jgi:hypothetical protein
MEKYYPFIAYSFLMLLISGFGILVLLASYDFGQEIHDFNKEI